MFYLCVRTQSECTYKMSSMILRRRLAERFKKRRRVHRKGTQRALGGNSPGPSSLESCVRSLGESQSLSRGQLPPVLVRGCSGGRILGAEVLKSSFEISKTSVFMGDGSLRPIGLRGSNNLCRGVVTPVLNWKLWGRAYLLFRGG
jgi:hypothetical protein